MRITGSPIDETAKIRAKIRAMPPSVPPSSGSGGGICSLFEAVDTAEHHSGLMSMGQEICLF